MSTYLNAGVGLALDMIGKGRATQYSAASP